METFHEVLPDNLVFFHFHYIGTKEIKPMDYTIVLYVKNCISEENYTSGVQTLPQTFRDQAVNFESPVPYSIIKLRNLIVAIIELRL